LFTFIQDELKSVEEIQQKFQQIIKSYTETWNLSESHATF
jgi:hypothetical protein